MFDLAAIYNDSNAQIVKSLISNIFLAVSNYKQDVEAFLDIL